MYRIGCSTVAVVVIMNPTRFLSSGSAATCRPRSCFITVDETCCQVRVYVVSVEVTSRHVRNGARTPHRGMALQSAYWQWMLPSQGLLPDVPMKSDAGLADVLHGLATRQWHQAGVALQLH